MVATRSCGDSWIATVSVEPLATEIRSRTVDDYSTVICLSRCLSILSTLNYSLSVATVVLFDDDGVCLVVAACFRSVLLFSLHWPLGRESLLGWSFFFLIPDDEGVCQRGIWVSFRVIWALKSCDRVSVPVVDRSWEAWWLPREARVAGYDQRDVSWTCRPTLCDRLHMWC